MKNLIIILLIASHADLYSLNAQSKKLWKRYHELESRYINITYDKDCGMLTIRYIQKSIDRIQKHFKRPRRQLTPNEQSVLTQFITSIQRYGASAWIKFLEDVYNQTELSNGIKGLIGERLIGECIDVNDSFAKLLCSDSNFINQLSNYIQEFPSWYKSTFN